MRRISAKTSSALFLFVGVLALGLGIFLTARMLTFVVNATRTQGTVVALESHTSTTRTAKRPYRERTSKTWRPVFEFKDAQGNVHRVTESFSSRPAMFSQGESVRVLYDAKNPEDARINAVKVLWLGPGLVGGAGVVLTLVGWFFRRHAARKSQETGPYA